MDYSDARTSLLLTIEKTQVHACSSESLVTKGRFTGFCVRFAEDFDLGLDDWKPDVRERPVMNACVVNQGTYKVCTKTLPKPTEGKPLISYNAPSLINHSHLFSGLVF